MIRMMVLAAMGATVTGCASADSAGQGGAQFRGAAPIQTSLPPESMFGVCWPPGSTGAVSLVFLPNDVRFETADGATNSTGRCLREIATTVVWSPRPLQLTVLPPSGPVAGFVALAWVKLLSSTRYGAERGLIDPAPLVRACLSLGPVRAPTRFDVAHEPGFAVHTIPEALTDSERCIEAVLSSTAWPSTRAFMLSFDDLAAAPSAQGDVTFYATPKTSSSGPLEPTSTQGTLSLRQAAVSACWDEARARRAGIGGSRTIRFRTKDGAVTDAWFTAMPSTSMTAAVADYRFDGCLAAALKATRFGSATGDGVHTWVFASKS